MFRFLLPCYSRSFILVETFVYNSVSNINKSLYTSLRNQAINMVNMNENVLARNGDNGRDHIPAVPFWVAIVRAVQFVCDLALCFRPTPRLSELTYMIAPSTSCHGSFCIRSFCVWRRLREFPSISSGSKALLTSSYSSLDMVREHCSPCNNMN